MNQERANNSELLIRSFSYIVQNDELLEYRLEETILMNHWILISAFSTYSATVV